MIAQELIGRPFLTFLGVKLTSIVWVMIALFLGLIFSMTLWPQFWRKLYSNTKNIQWKLIVFIMVLLLLVFIIGMFIGFKWV